MVSTQEEPEAARPILREVLARLTALARVTVSCASTPSSLLSDINVVIVAVPVTAVAAVQLPSISQANSFKLDIGNNIGPP